MTAIVVIAQNGKRRQGPARQMPEYSIHLGKSALTPVTDKIASDRQNIWSQMVHAVERIHQILIVDPGTNVKVANLNQALSNQSFRQLRHWKGTLDQFHPMWLDPPGVQPCSHG